MTDVSPQREVALADRLAAAGATLDAAAGTTSLCTLSRAGVPMPGIKYPEGAWSALREVMREAHTSGDVCASARAVRQRWSDDLTRHQGRGSGPDWIAYVTGGVDAIDGLLAEACPSSGEH